jgi:hypothetical protein
MCHRARALTCIFLLLAVAGCDRPAGTTPAPVKAPDTTELSVFAHANIPEVERLIDDLSLQIIDRQSRLKDLNDALRLAKREPKDDAEYRKWSDMIVRLNAVLEEAKTLRADTYVAWQKHLLASGAGAGADEMAAIFDGATAKVIKQREEIASIAAGLPPVKPVAPVVTATPPGPGKTTGTTAGAPVAPTRPVPKLVVLPLRNATTAQVTVTEVILAGTPDQRYSVKAPFDQYAHGPRTSLASWAGALGAKAVNRAEVDALLVSPAPAAAVRGIADGAGLDIARRLGASFVLTGEFDAITAVKKPRPENVSTTRDIYAVTARYRLDLLRAADGRNLASKTFEFNDNIIEGQFRGFGDATVAARIVRGMATTVQDDQAFAQAVKAAMQ